jgi:hypothetical protein
MKNKLSPIVLFVYNRPEHTKRTLEALQNNDLAQDSELIIFSDEAKNEGARESVDEVRAYLDSISGFKSTTVIRREKNWGLASSIIDGVTKIVGEYGKVIVLEDDLVTSKYFLTFMNDALSFYEDEKNVWHISGWNYPIERDGLDDVFLWRLMNCWGWATWLDRWDKYEKNIDKTLREFTKDDIKGLNLDNAEPFFNQVVANKNRKLDTWAIFWYTTIFKNGGFCLNPSQTFVENIGHDGSGMNCDQTDAFIASLSSSSALRFVDTLEENTVALNRIKRFYRDQKKSFISRFSNKVLSLFLDKV